MKNTIFIRPMVKKLLDCLYGNSRSQKGCCYCVSEECLTKLSRLRAPRALYEKVAKLYLCSSYCKNLVDVSIATKMLPILLSSCELACAFLTLF